MQSQIYFYKGFNCTDHTLPCAFIALISV